jgi:peptidoglycan hydrolase CwlO-like protein
MNKTKLLSILNTAGEADLVKLPGVGPALSGRIIAGRPYKSLDAVIAVKGVSASLMTGWMEVPVKEPEKASTIDPKSVAQSLKPDQTASPDQQSFLENTKGTIVGKGQELGEKMSELGDSVKKRGKAVFEAARDLPEDFERESKARGPLWTLMVSNGVTALLSILLTLLILWVINGSLKYATGSQYRTMRGEVTVLTEQANRLQQDQESLRSRVDTLEGLGERIVTLESEQQQLAADLETTRQQVDAMQARITALNDKVNEQDVRTLRFEAFLKELQTLLGNLFVQGGTQ